MFEGKFDGLGLAGLFLGRGGVGENQSVDDVDSGGADPVVVVDDCVLDKMVVSLVVAVVTVVVAEDEGDEYDDDDDVVDVVLAFKVTGGMSRGLLKNWKAH